MEFTMRKWSILVLGITLSGPLSAKAVELVGTIPVVISASEDLKSYAGIKSKVVFVQNIRLSPSAQQVLKQRLAHIFENSNLNASYSSGVPTQINLGMNGTPVLDQGVHGSCVTFAMTGAFDAVLGRGDYISQLCSLELGAYLYQLGRSEYSGWDGSTGAIVLKQLNDYGVIPKSYQQQHGCAGVKRYPINTESNTGKPMPLKEYIANSLPLSFATWQVLADTEEVFSDKFNPTALLRAVKKHLREGRRVTFGMLLDDTIGEAGALGTYKKGYDTWVLTPEIIKKIEHGDLEAGHEMILIGYDDSAVAYTPDGKASKGIFIVRNSWGKQSGDGGNFYISYDYFKALCDEAQVIIPRG
jgi:hypothetical protein